MRRIDELHMDIPFADTRMLRDLLAADSFKVGRLHVSTLMKKMAIEAIYRRPNTSKPARGHKVYPYLLRKPAVTLPNHVWATNITLHPHGARLRLPASLLRGQRSPRFDRPLSDFLQRPAPALVA
nr:hypothetical protein [Sandarakinorhabdus sp.]